VIVVDASAVLAVYFGEPERSGFLEILETSSCVISPVNHWEILARVQREHGSDGVLRVEALLAKFAIKVATVGAAESRAAHQAFARFGKGCGGPLNLGDCFAYALAQSEGDGLLFKGDDFPKTDVKSALA